MVLKNRLKQILLNIDVTLGHVPFKIDAYVKNDALTGGTGIYTREEWGERRLNGYNNAGRNLEELSSNERYIARCFAGEFRKFLLGIRLTRCYDFSGVQNLLEIGCGEMIPSYALSMALPYIKVTAADYDPVIIQQMEKLSVLDRIEKKICDVTCVTPDFFKPYDLIFSVDLFYSLTTEQILKVFRSLKESRTKMIIGSSQVIGPLRYASYHIKNFLLGARHRSYSHREKTGQLRRHGWKRSVGEYTRMAKQCGLCATLISPAPVDSSYGDSYYLILVTGH